MKYFNHKWLYLTLFVLAFSLQPQAVDAQQIRAGSAFLKVLPGARQQGYASSLTGVIDEIHALYANPASLGFAREWQWSASYSKIMPEIYNTSLVAGLQDESARFGTNNFALNMVYLGVPLFDSSEGAAPSISASDMLAGFTYAHPWTTRHGQFSLGFNAKYYRKTLADYQASTYIFDVGGLWRSNRFGTGKLGELIPALEMGILSFGAAATQLGAPLQYISEETPLPRTIRFGSALHLGSHNGFQMHLSGDFHNVMDEGGQFSFGTEISWAQLISVRSGYNFEKDALSNFSFGMSLHLQDGIASLSKVLPGRNNAMRMDFASGQANTFFDSPYRGGITHYPVGPENFLIVHPKDGAIIEAEDLILNWTASTDPDLYDEVSYRLIIDQRRTIVESIVTSILETGKSGTAPSKSLAKIDRHTQFTNHQLAALEGGDYYWSVIAIDKDGHARVMDVDGQHIAKFGVPAPELEIEELTFDYSKWITEDDYQGKLVVKIKNTGHYYAQDFRVRIDDLTAPQFTAKADGSSFIMEPLYVHHVPKLGPGEVHTIAYEWYSEVNGLHEISVKVDEDNRVREGNEDNNQMQKGFYTIPKGSVSTDDTVTAHILSKINYDLPFIAEIYFEKNSTKVQSEYIRDWVLEPPLATLARRLRANRHIGVSLQGFIDPNSNEMNLSLADARAKAVQDSLVKLGVYENQLSLIPGESHPRRTVPADTTDARWVFQERRNVVITAGEAENVLFTPVTYNDIEKLPIAINFYADLWAALPFKSSELVFQHSYLVDSMNVSSLFDSKRDVHTLLSWAHSLTNPAEPSLWIGKTVDYHIMVRDSLGREFLSHDRKFHLESEANLREQRFSWPLKFADTEPFYEFYWVRLFKQINRMLGDDSMRMRFIGHACAVGPEHVNLRLSKKRATVFRERFLRTVQRRHPKAYMQIFQRLDGAKGYGEDHPLGVVRTSGDFFLIGDNESPLGRKLNRRIEISFYSDDKPLKPAVNE